MVLEYVSHTVVKPFKVYSDVPTGLHLKNTFRSIASFKQSISYCLVLFRIIFSVVLLLLQELGQVQVDIISNMFSKQLVPRASIVCIVYVIYVPLYI